jgi:hypothetical protein
VCSGGLVCNFRFCLVNSLLRAAAAAGARTVVTLPLFTRRGAEFSPSSSPRAGPGRAHDETRCAGKAAAMFSDDQVRRILTCLAAS